jgi:hypothetical protein
MKPFEEFIRDFDDKEDDENLCPTEMMCLAWNSAIERAAKKCSDPAMRIGMRTLKYEEDPNSL